MQQRIQYLDAMRGWAIFIVVWVHDTWLMLGADVCWLYSFAVVYPMPLFFAVSGYLRGGKTGRRNIPWKRWLKMLILLAAGSLGYAWLANEPVTDMFTIKYYYWFFAALLLCELFVELLLPLLRMYGAILSTIGACVIWLLFFCAWQVLGPNKFGIPFADMEQYWPFYWLGLLMAVYPKLLNILTCRVCALAGALTVTAAVYTWQEAGTVLGLLGGLGGLSITWYLFCRADRRLRLMVWLGRQSLGVFLLSYPVLKLCAPIGALFPRAWVDTPWQWLTAFVVAVPVTLVMALITELCKRCGKKLLTLSQN